MKCKNCDSGRLIDLTAKCRDQCAIDYYGDSMGKRSYHYYAPDHIGLGDEADYVEMTICLDCGMIQSDDFPVSDETLRDIF